MSTTYSLACLLGLALIASAQPTARSQFELETEFELGPASQRLLGGRFNEIRKAHLPTWFDFELFKKRYGKHYADPSEELARHHAYVATCVRVLKARVLYRILASTQDAFITRDADQVSSRPTRRWPRSSQ